MGCVVNGPGEARDADPGVASGNGKGQIFVKGEVIKTVPEAQIVETLIEEAMRLAESMPGGDGASEDASGPTVMQSADGFADTVRELGLLTFRPSSSCSIAIKTPTAWLPNVLSLRSLIHLDLVGQRGAGSQTAS